MPDRTTSSVGTRIQEVIDCKCDDWCKPSVRATLIKIADAFDDLRAGLIFSDVADAFENNSTAECEFFDACYHIGIASLSFKKAANTL